MGTHFDVSDILLFISTFSALPFAACFADALVWGLGAVDVVHLTLTIGAGAE